MRKYLPIIGIMVGLSLFLFGFEMGSEKGRCLMDTGVVVLVGCVLICLIYGEGDSFD